MDESVASYYISIVKRIKVAKWGTPKKNIKKDVNNLSNAFLNLQMSFVFH
jgi:hypothetical protein